MSNIILLFTDPETELVFDGLWVLFHLHDVTSAVHNLVGDIKKHNFAYDFGRDIGELVYIVNGSGFKEISS